MAEGSRYHDRAWWGKKAFHFHEHVSNFGFDLSATPDQITRDKGVSHTYLPTHVRKKIPTDRWPFYQLSRNVFT
jgi:hypothetical protein